MNAFQIHKSRNIYAIHLVQSMQHIDIMLTEKSMDASLGFKVYESLFTFPFLWNFDIQLKIY